MKISRLWLWEKIKESIPVLARASATPKWIQYGNFWEEGKSPGWQARL